MEYSSTHSVIMPLRTYLCSSVSSRSKSSPFYSSIMRIKREIRAMSPSKMNTSKSRVAISIGVR